MAPKRPQTAPKRPQTAPKRPPNGPETAPYGPKRPQTAPNGPKRPPNGPKRPPNGPQTGPEGLGWAPVGSGGRVLGRNPLGQRVGPLPPVSCPSLPRGRCVASIGPKRPQTGPNGRGTGTTGGPVAVSWDGIHLGPVRASFRSWVPCLYPVKGGGGMWPQDRCTTAPTPNGGLKTGGIGFCLKCPSTSCGARRRFEALFRWSVWGPKRGQKRPKRSFFPKRPLDQSGCSDTRSEPVWRLSGALLRLRSTPNPLSTRPISESKGVQKGAETCLPARDPGHPPPPGMPEHMFGAVVDPKEGPNCL